MSAIDTALPARPKPKPMSDEVALVILVIICIGVVNCILYLGWWSFGLLLNPLFYFPAPVLLVCDKYPSKLAAEKMRKYNRIQLGYWIATLGAILTLPLLAIVVAGSESPLAIGSQVAADLGVLLFALGSLLPRQPNLKRWRMAMLARSMWPILASNLLALFALRYH